MKWDEFFFEGVDFYLKPSFAYAHAPKITQPGLLSQKETTPNSHRSRQLLQHLRVIIPTMKRILFAFDNRFRLFAVSDFSQG